MATADRRANRAKRRYNTPGPIDGNLARKLDSRELERQLDNSGRMDFDQLYQRPVETAAERNARRRAQVKASVRPAQWVSPAMLGFIGVAVLMVALLLCYVRLNSISRSIVSMKTEIAALEVEQVSLVTKYEQTFDLSSVKQAAEAAGMGQPSDSQVYYISLPGENQATVHSAGHSALEKFFAFLGRGVFSWTD